MKTSQDLVLLGKTDTMIIAYSPLAKRMVTGKYGADNLGAMGWPNEITIKYTRPARPEMKLLRENPREIRQALEHEIRFYQAALQVF